MTLDEKRTALAFLYMVTECYEAYDDEEIERVRLAFELVQSLEQQNDDAIQHRDVTRIIQEKNPQASLALCRKAATDAIKRSKVK